MDVYKWACSAQEGSRLVYHDGHEVPPPQSNKTALRASDEGLVFLCQRRRKTGGFEYEAWRISKRCLRIITQFQGRLYR